MRDGIEWIEERTLAQSAQVTGERLVKAFETFFELVAAGETAGYPRFKSTQRYSGFGFKAEGQAGTQSNGPLTLDPGSATARCNSRVSGAWKTQHAEAIKLARWFSGFYSRQCGCAVQRRQFDAFRRLVIFSDRVPAVRISVCSFLGMFANNTQRGFRATATFIARIISRLR